MDINKKSIPMSILIGALTIAFVMFALGSWLPETMENSVRAIIVGAIGAGVIYFSIVGSKLERFVNQGLVYAGVGLIIISVFIYWPDVNENFKPIVIGIGLIGSIYFGSKYKKEIF